MSREHFNLAQGEADAVIDHVWEDGKVKSPIAVHYLAEGAANIIYRLESTGYNQLPIEMQGCLLRLRKDKTTSPGYSALLQSFEERMTPIFEPRYLLKQRLWRLPSGLIADLNAALLRRENNDRRPPKRRGLYLTPQTEEEYGILIEDLSPRLENEILLEFKPKWLLRSPSAPKGAQRCRTCALRDMRKSDDITIGRGDSGFCPLDLLSGKSSVLRPALGHIWTVDDRLAAFETLFRQKVQRLLGVLKGLQSKHGDVGLLSLEQGAEKELAVAMAIRDCSVFMKVQHTPESVEIVDVRLGDLDLKTTAGGKRQKWVETERRLINEGWYEGKIASGKEGQEVVCWISRTCT